MVGLRFSRSLALSIGSYISLRETIEVCITRLVTSQWHYHTMLMGATITVTPTKGGESWLVTVPHLVAVQLYSTVIEYRYTNCSILDVAIIADYPYLQRYNIRRSPCTGGCRQDKGSHASEVRELVGLRGCGDGET